MGSANDWRSVMAALANETSLRVYARLVLGAIPDEATSGLSPSRRAHALTSLQKAGLVDEDIAPRTTRFADMLAASPSSARPTGVDRYLDRDGRVVAYPSRPTDRANLLRLLASRAFAVGEVLDERAVNGRLSTLTGDVALLRRHLVDHGILERTRSGSAYALTPPEIPDAV